MWSRGSGLGWQLAESIGQWVSFGEGRASIQPRVSLARSLERESVAVEVLLDPARRSIRPTDRTR